MNHLEILEYWRHMATKVGSCSFSLFQTLSTGIVLRNYTAWKRKRKKQLEEIAHRSLFFCLFYKWQTAVLSMFNLFNKYTKCTIIILKHCYLSRDGNACFFSPGLIALTACSYEDIATCPLHTIMLPRFISWLDINQ